MEKEKLQDGDIVELADGSRYMVMHNKRILVNSVDFLAMDAYTEQLNSKFSKDRNIVKVRRPYFSPDWCEKNWGKVPTIFTR